MEDKRIAIIGAGNLGKSIAEGLVEKHVVEAGSIILTRRNVSSLESLKHQGYLVASENKEAANASDIIILCVQPNQLAEVLDEMAENLSEKKPVISVITGISIDEIASQVGKEVPIARAMPNTAIAIGESMTCIASSNKELLKTTKEIFDALGKTAVIEEDLMQAATVLGASGIAFFMRYLRAATQGGIQMGFDAENAQLIVMQTARGAASLVMENGSHPEVEIDKVTTPQGCTIEGLNEMEHQGFSSALIQGIMTSFKRITKMKSAKEE